MPMFTPGTVNSKDTDSRTGAKKKPTDHTITSHANPPPMPKIATLADLESGTPSGLAMDQQGNLLCRAGNTTWSLNVILWAGLMIVANLLHPPVIVMFFGNGALLALNLNAIRLAGNSNTPMWLWVVVALQSLITLQYGSYLLQGRF